VFRHCDVLHAPVVTIPTPTLAETDASGSDAMLQAVAKMGRWTRPINYLGLPALSLPAGLWKGMPFGCQLVAPKRREALLLEVGSAYQAELGFVTWAPNAV
jgi:aspartyl-tRNA(Asn)/glutamyl-tRNA(Gln) amidotransferase subunit A